MLARPARPLLEAVALLLLTAACGGRISADPAVNDATAPESCSAGTRELGVLDGFVLGVTASTDFVYVTRTLRASGDLVRIPSAGGSPETVVSGVVGSFLIEDATLYYLLADAIPDGDAGSMDFVYPRMVVRDLVHGSSFDVLPPAPFDRVDQLLAVATGPVLMVHSDEGSQAVFRYDPATRGLVLLTATDVMYPMVYDRDVIYWTTWGADAGLFAMPSAGGAPRRLRDAAPVEKVVGFTGDAVITAEPDTGTLAATPFEGGQAEPYARGLDLSFSVVAQGRTAYWIGEKNPDTVYRLRLEAGLAAEACWQEKGRVRVLSASAADLYWTIMGQSTHTLRTKPF